MGSPPLTALVDMLQSQDETLSLPPADDLDDAAGRALAVWMMEDAAPWPEAAAPMLAEIATLHRDHAADDDAAWPRMRREAVAFGDHADQSVRNAGAVAEAAAWPLSKARAVLCEIYRAVSRVRFTRAAGATGWTREDEEKAHAIMRQLAQGDGGTPPDRTQIPGLFAAADPELERRFSVQLGASNNAPRKFGQEVAEKIRELAGSH